jgi:hypothetical protein
MVSDTVPEIGCCKHLNPYFSLLHQVIDHKWKVNLTFQRILFQILLQEELE